MACLPQATGGRHFNAQNAEQVGRLHRRGAAALGLRDGRRARLAAASPSAAAIVPPPPLPASGPPALHLRACWPPIPSRSASPLYWTVTAEARPDVPLFGARAANPTVPVTARAVHGRGARRPAGGQADGGSARQQTRNRHHGCSTQAARASRAVPQRTADVLAGCSHHRQPMPTDALLLAVQGRRRSPRCCRQAVISCAPNSDLCVPSRP